MSEEIERTLGESAHNYVGLFPGEFPLDGQ